MHHHPHQTETEKRALDENARNEVPEPQQQPGEIRWLANTYTHTYIPGQEPNETGQTHKKKQRDKWNRGSAAREDWVWWDGPMPAGVVVGPCWCSWSGSSIPPPSPILSPVCTLGLAYTVLDSGGGGGGFDLAWGHGGKWSDDGDGLCLLS